MALALQEILDRFEIMDLLVDYCTAIDTKDLDALDLIFTSDAQLTIPKPEVLAAVCKQLRNFWLRIWETCLASI
ncbi:MAG TPA: nuclear transport factor 2 family protein [Rhabdochlamydiaceae bacterium]|jgi:hypothetical protein|nr:nuclear transport factor 2 family protein [Rhabdochlamydiaceae bacterium]